MGRGILLWLLGVPLIAQWMRMPIANYYTARAILAVRMIGVTHGLAWNFSRFAAWRTPLETTVRTEGAAWVDAGSGISWASITRGSDPFCDCIDNWDIGLLFHSPESRGGWHSAETTAARLVT